MEPRVSPRPDVHPGNKRVPLSQQNKHISSGDPVVSLTNAQRKNIIQPDFLKTSTLNFEKSYIEVTERPDFGHQTINTKSVLPKSTKPKKNVQNSRISGGSSFNGSNTNLQQFESSRSINDAFHKPLSENNSQQNVNIVTARPDVSSSQDVGHMNAQNQVSLKQPHQSTPVVPKHKTLSESNSQQNYNKISPRPDLSSSVINDSYKTVQNNVSLQQPHPSTPVVPKHKTLSESNSQQNFNKVSPRPDVSSGHQTVINSSSDRQPINVVPKEIKSKNVVVETPQTSSRSSALPKVFVPISNKDLQQQDHYPTVVVPTPQTSSRSSLHDGNNTDAQYKGNLQQPDSSASTTSSFDKPLSESNFQQNFNKVTPRPDDVTTSHSSFVEQPNYPNFIQQSINNAFQQNEDRVNNARQQHEQRVNNARQQHEQRVNNARQQHEQRFMKASKPKPLNTFVPTFNDFQQQNHSPENVVPKPKDNISFEGRFAKSSKNNGVENPVKRPQTEAPSFFRLFMAVVFVCIAVALAIFVTKNNRRHF